MQKFSYHTHTNFSDGSNTLEDMLNQAVKLGWKEIGISDHLVIHEKMKESPLIDLYMKHDYGNIYLDDFHYVREKLLRRGEEFRKIVQKFPIKVYLGYEVDYFTYDGWEDKFRKLIADIDYDYLINGNHFFMDENGQNILDIYRYNIRYPEGDTQLNFEGYLRRHYQTLAKAVKSGMFVFLAHLDYARKVAQHKSYPMIEERLQVVQALKEAGIGCEISTKGLRKINDFYPERVVLEELIKQKVPLVISDDAHNVNELGYDFDKAEAELEILNCQHRFEMDSVL